MADSGKIVTIGQWLLAIAAVDINGQPYIAGMNTDQANQSSASAPLFADILSTVRPIS